MDAPTNRHGSCKVTIKPSGYAACARLVIKHRLPSEKPTFLRNIDFVTEMKSYHETHILVVNYLYKVHHRTGVTASRPQTVRGGTMGQEGQLGLAKGRQVPDQLHDLALRARREVSHNAVRICGEDGDRKTTRTVQPEWYWCVVGCYMGNTTEMYYRIVRSM